MPWEIKQNYGGCAGYAVVKEGTAEVEGCHSSRSKAEGQMAALYASETDKAVVTNEVTPNKNPQGIRGSKKKEKPYKIINKAESVRVGQMVSWNSSGGRATGKVTRIVRDGKYNVPNSGFTITGTPDDPAAVIRLYRDGKPTDTVVGHKVSTLRSVGKSMDSIELIKNIIASWDNEEVIEKSSAIESDSSEKTEVPEDLAAIFSGMPTHAKRVNTMGNAPISLNLFRNEEHGRRNL